MFTVYSMTNCPHCVGAKELLKSKGFKIRVKEAGVDFQREELVELVGPVRTLPQIILEEDGITMHIGGFSELQRYFAGIGEKPRVLSHLSEAAI